MVDTAAFVEANLTRDPERRELAGGNSVVNVGLAVNESFTRADGSKAESVSFYDGEVWGPQGDNLMESARKGSRIVGQGRLKVDTWETEDGQKRSKVKLVLQHVGLSCRFDTYSTNGKKARVATPAVNEDGTYDEEPF